MGAENSVMRTEEDFHKDFEEIRRESDIHYGSVIIYRNKKNPKLTVLVKEKLILTQDELTNFLDQARLRSSIKGNNIAPLVEFFVHTDKKLCSTTYKAMIGFEFHDRTLEKLLRQRKTYETEEAQTMTEVDAWGVLTDLIHGLKAYRDKGVLHGDIQPANIFVLNDKTLKLIDTCYMCDQRSAFERRYQDCNYKSPMSPQALRALALGPNYATFDREKNDIWSIGVTLLVSLTNEDYNIFYDWHNQELQYDFILSRLRRIQQMGYSSDFMRALKFMLEKDESRRISLNSMLDFMNKANKPVYVSELRELETSLDQEIGSNHILPQQIQKQMEPMQAQNVSQGTRYPIHQNTDIYGNPLPLDSSLVLQSGTSNFDLPRQTAPIPIQAPFGFNQQPRRNSPQPQRFNRERSPLGHNFLNMGGFPQKQQQQAPQNPQTSARFTPILRDLGNIPQNGWREPQHQNFQQGHFHSQKHIQQPLMNKPSKREQFSARGQSPIKFFNENSYSNLQMHNPQFERQHWQNGQMFIPK